MLCFEQEAIPSVTSSWVGFKRFNVTDEQGNESAKMLLLCWKLEIDFYILGKDEIFGGEFFFFLVWHFFFLLMLLLLSYALQLE